jgi:biopolymer transport protein TolQ
MDIINIVLSAGLMVQFVLALLLFFSIASWTIMIMKYRYIKRAFYESAIFIDFFWKSRDLSDAFNKAKQLKGSPIARVFRVGYMELRKLSPSGGSTTPETSKPHGVAKGPLKARFAGIDTVKRSLRRAINTETTRMTRMVPFLATTGNTTPFIGLFGTVWGIMNSFHGIGIKGSASLAVVAPGISEALIATAAGLAAAIPAVIAFNHFMYKIRIIESELQNFSADFLNIIERSIIK